MATTKVAPIDPTVQQIEALAAQQLAAQKAELEAQRNKAVLEEQQKAALIAPKYTQAKQSANVQSQLGARNFAEYLAQRGMTNFGLSGQGEISRQNALAGQVQGFNTAQSADELASQQNIAGLNTQYATGLTGIQNTINTNKAQALLDYAAELRERKAAADEATIAWNRQITEQKRQEALAGLTKKKSSGGSSGGSYTPLTSTPKKKATTTTKQLGITTAKGSIGNIDALTQKYGPTYVSKMANNGQIEVYDDGTYKVVGSPLFNKDNKKVVKTPVKTPKKVIKGANSGWSTILKPKKATPTKSIRKTASLLTAGTKKVPNKK